MVVEVVGHDVEPVIAIEIGHDNAPRASRGPLAPDVLFLVDTAGRWLDAKGGSPLVS